MTRRIANFVAMLVFAELIAIPDGFCQLLKSPPEQERKAGATSTIDWGDKALVERLAKSLTAGPRIVAPQSEQGPNSAVLAVLRQKRASGEFNGGMSKGGVRPTNVGPPNTPVPGSIVPGQVKSANGTGSVGTAPAPTALSVQQGPTRQNPPGTNTSPTNQARRTAPPAPICLNNGISAVDGAKAGATFSPGYSYKIQGCGFGTTPGQIYLTGIRNQNISNGSITQAPSRLHSDWVSLLIAPGKWSDSYIEAVVDPTTSGFYDSPDATLRIVTSDNRTLWSPGFRFYATRAQQTLASLPRTMYGGSRSPARLTIITAGAGFSPAHVTDAAGHAVQAHLCSPSAVCLLPPGYTFAVIRNDSAAPFPAGTDTLDLTEALEPNGFEITGLNPFYAKPTQQVCGPKFSTNGNWNALRTGFDTLNVSWQEQSCSGDNVSAYAVDIVVEGPSGVSPF
jgi:hypothetical protein